MLKSDPSGRDGFTSNLGVIAAAAGSAIGLGNIWRFPYVAGENGGGAFLFIYLAFVLAIGIPVMLSEFTIGRSAQRNPIGAFLKLAPGKPWFLIGIFGVFAAFLILAFYAAVAGWTFEYVYQSLTNSFTGKTNQQLSDMFEGFRSGSIRPVLWFFVCMVLTAGIVMSGVSKGIEKYTKILMPVLLVILIILCVRAITLPGARDGLAFLFNPELSKITPETILKALGQAFFSLSIGMGTLITYGSYIRKQDNLGNTAVSVALADTFIAILAGVAIFPAVYALDFAKDIDGFTENVHEGLVFIILPELFQKMTGGYFFAVLFFLLLSVAAVTSTISVLEVVTAYFSEELNMSRKKATIIAASSISVLGVFAAAAWSWFSGLTIAEMNVFALLEFTTANLLLPIGGFFIVIYVGWFMGKKNVRKELSNEGKLKARLLAVFMFLVRYIAPVAILLVFLNSIGALRFLTG